MLQALMRFIDTHRPLHRQALSGLSLVRKTVGVRLSLQLLPAGIDLGRILLEPGGKTKQLEVVAVEIHTRKDSPQPQRSRSFGLMNLKPSLSPSRTKSSCVPSM